MRGRHGALRRPRGAQRRLAARRARHHARDHRAQRRGQVDAAERPHRRLPRRAPAASTTATRAHAAAPAADRRAGDQPHVPEPRAVADRDRAREPAARPSPALEGGLRHRRPAAAGGRAASSPSRSGSSTASRALWGLAEVLDAPMGALPYGVRKRAEVARALCAEPVLLLLDEPVAGMNADESAEMARSIVQSREALGISIVLVEHDMPFVMGLADRVTVLDFGEVIADGTPRRRPARPGGAARLPGVRGGVTRRRRRQSGMSQFFELFLSGLMLGCIYGLIAMGFVIVFKATNVVNFAHASIVMLGRVPGGEVARLARASSARSPSAAVVCAAAAALLDFVFVRPLRRRGARRRRAGDHDHRAQHPARDRARAPGRERPAALRRAVGREHDGRPRRGRSRRRASRRPSSRWR